MRHVAVLGLAVLVTGCGPTFKLNKPGKLTCGEGFHTWGGGLTNHVQQGNGAGDFDYIPAAAEVQRIHGNYNLKTGDFFWYEEYIEASHIQFEHAVGFGTLWTDGDLSIQYDYDVQYDDEDLEQYDVRELRLSCGVDRRVEDSDGLVQVFEGAYQEGGFVYTKAFTEGPDTYTSEGRLEPDGTWFESIDSTVGPVHKEFEEVGDGEGYVRREFLDQSLGFDLEGYWERYLDGTRHAEYTSQASGGQLQAWEYTIDGAGNGEGTLEYGQQRCDLSFEADACDRVSCSDGAEGSCQPPIDVPRISGPL